jgi:hypothetical protein
VSKKEDKEESITARFTLANCTANSYACPNSKSVKNKMINISKK